MLPIEKNCCEEKAVSRFMRGRHTMLGFCLILLTLLAFTSQAQAQDVPETLVYEKTQAVGPSGAPPDPNPFYINPDEGTLASRVVWEENKQLEAGPDSLGVIIHGATKASPSSVSCWMRA